MPRGSYEDLRRLSLQFEKIEKCSIKLSISDRRNSAPTRSILKNKSPIADVTKRLSPNFECSVENEINDEDIDIIDVNLKNVTFADDRNCDLVEVRKFVPSSENLDLWSNCEYFQEKRTETKNYKERVITLNDLVVTPELALCFTDPYMESRFAENLYNQYVALERCGVRDRTITCIIVVRNIEYKKRVFVRFTIDMWKSYSDIDGKYIPNSSDGENDRFICSLVLPKYSSELQFAVGYKLSSHEHWDNNGGKNFIVQDVLYDVER